MAAQKLILITGVSSGFGRALAQAALAAGYRVVGTVRSDTARRDFERLGAGALARILDVTDFDAIGSVVAGIEADVGPIDVLVNNAGYGHEGILEESPLGEMRRQFDVNVFGAVAVTKAVLPFMRARRRGRILNVTSMGGHITMPGIAYYDALFEPVRQARIEKSGKQLGDPAKAAQAMLRLIDAADPPAHLLLGSDSLRLVRGKLAALAAQLDEWEAVTVSTDG